MQPTKKEEELKFKLVITQNILRQVAQKLSEAEDQINRLFYLISNTDSDEKLKELQDVVKDGDVDLFKDFPFNFTEITD